MRLKKKIRNITKKIMNSKLHNRPNLKFCRIKIAHHRTFIKTTLVVKCSKCFLFEILCVSELMIQNLLLNKSKSEYISPWHIVLVHIMLPTTIQFHAMDNKMCFSKNNGEFIIHTIIRLIDFWRWPLKVS